MEGSQGRLKAGRVADRRTFLGSIEVPRAIGGLIVLVVLSVGASGVGVARTALSHCAFQQVGGAFKGSCAVLDQSPAMMLAPAAAITSGIWRDDVRPSAVWAGDADRDSPIEIEVYSGGWGIMRTEYGWFPVTNFASSPTLSFDVDAGHEIVPGALDEQIVRRAAEILSSDRWWNRADDRRCPAGAKTWSIYCALAKATVEVTGGFHHRRPAQEIVRVIIEERTVGRGYHHRLMGYNNDPLTHLRDVQSVFTDALARMEDTSWLQAHDFVPPPSLP
jgi:hypothetical protein